ncbi:MAG: phosphoribosyl-AMP cyclohydrolase [Candidatus Poseidoniaceae archaeon]
MITVADVEDAQRKWGDGIVRIATEHETGGDYTGIATKHVEDLYAYDRSEVLFKPTMASIEQFRPTFEGALSYFVASNGVCNEDSGFAIKGWTAVRFENSGIIINEANAIAMGNYFFTGADGNETKVEYTFGYIPDEVNNLRIVLHHSSLPASA